MSTPHVVVLAIDGLRASALGAYGNTWRPTPALDRLACGSLLCEWAFAGSGSPLEVYQPSLFAENAWGRARLVTDDPAVARLAACEPFDEATVVESPPVEAPAAALSETQLAAVFATFAETTLEEAANDHGPRLTWLHCGSLTKAWDAPSAWVEELVEEDDPTPEASAVPAADRVSRRDDPDAIFCAACRYAAQVAVLDACLEGWLGVIDSVAAGDGQSMTLMVLGLRGYALGEHGVIGLDEAGPYSESRHVPLLVRAAGATPGQRWADRPLRVEQAASILRALASRPEAANAANQLALHSSEAAVLTGDNHRAVRTSDWFLLDPRRGDPQATEPGDAGPSGPELYLKPDDRWEANDVASLRPEIVDELQRIAQRGAEC